MVDELIINSTDKEGIYREVLPQIKALVEGEENLVANISNIMSALKYGFDFFWVGCYFVDGDELILGPFQGPVACTRIKKGKGVCGTAWEEERIIIVDDVEQFPGHIACSSESKSEIVLPIFNKERKVQLILDIDSDELSTFDYIDQVYLTEVVNIIESLL